MIKDDNESCCLDKVKSCVLQGSVRENNVECFGLNDSIFSVAMNAIQDVLPHNMYEPPTMELSLTQKNAIMLEGPNVNACYV